MEDSREVRVDSGVAIGGLPTKRRTFAQRHRPAISVSLLSLALEAVMPMCIYLHNEDALPIAETSRAKVVRRLTSEGWTNEGGAKHDKFVKGGSPPILVPRHRALTPGVARSIAKAAGWI